MLYFNIYKNNINVYCYGCLDEKEGKKHIKNYIKEQFGITKGYRIVKSKFQSNIYIIQL